MGEAQRGAKRESERKVSKGKASKASIGKVAWASKRDKQIIKKKRETPPPRPEKKRGTLTERTVHLIAFRLPRRPVLREQESEKSKTVVPHTSMAPKMGDEETCTQIPVRGRMSESPKIPLEGCRIPAVFLLCSSASRGPHTRLLCVPAEMLQLGKTHLYPTGYPDSVMRHAEISCFPHFPASGVSAFEATIKHKMRSPPTPTPPHPPPRPPPPPPPPPHPHLVIFFCPPLSLRSFAPADLLGSRNILTLSPFQRREKNCRLKAR